jgi:GalNAc-alpha-(1->4)-GalNAc-alpha-(1->3)-diNAcBac-PP-undecaprenol alpha-1,4-N-acetyl-D-galactosaminyltransferase
MFTRSINNVLGGLERQIFEISKYFSNNGYKVLIISLDSGEVSSFYKQETNSKLKWEGIGIGNPNLKATILEKIKRQIKLVKIIKEFDPDISLSFMIGSFIYSRIPLFICKKKLILSERNSPEIYNLTSAKKYKHFYFILMIFANKITVQFDSYKDKYPKYLRKKIITIPNAIVEHKLINKRTNKTLRFIYAGRFSFQKQLPKLLYGFQRFKQLGGLANLTLVGSGERESEIINLITELEIQDFVEIKQPEQDMAKIFETADVNCLFSLWEGFPNSVAEGLRVGIPTIGFKECAGVSDLITDGYNGWLVSDDSNYELIGKKFVEIEKIYMIDSAIIQENCKRSVAKYTNDFVYSKWLQLLQSTQVL